MDFSTWLEQQKTDQSQISDFISKIEGLFGKSGFDGAEFEKRVNAGLTKIVKDVDSSFTAISNA